VAAASANDSRIRMIITEQHGKIIPVPRIKARRDFCKKKTPKEPWRSDGLKHESSVNTFKIYGLRNLK
jgi:hypothetical protein